MVLGGGLALGGLWLGAHHPVAPGLVMGAMAVIGVVVAARPRMLWFLLPAALPVMSFMPWTGWWLLDESDLLVLSCLGGAFLRQAWDVHRSEPTGRMAVRRVPVLIWGLLAVSLVVGVWRGLQDAGAAWTSWPTWNEAVFAGYDSVWNTWRVAKSLLWALLLAPLLLAPEPAGRAAVPRQVARGMLFGLGLVCCTVVWERSVYAGLFDFSQAYRTTAWFWEMHTGGGAIDAYLALAVPFAVWGMWTSPTLWRWLGSSLLMVLAVYAVLTTYSRGVYLAVLLAWLLMGILAWRTKLTAVAGAPWRYRTLLAVLVALVLECALVLGGGSFMTDRLSRSETDLVDRMDHWRSGLRLLKTPQDGVWGLGLGRFPAHYSAEVPGRAFPGRADWRVNDSGQGHVLLSAHNEVGQRINVFALTQRFQWGDGDTLRVRLRASGEEGSRLLVGLCQRHLLYDIGCSWQSASLQPAWVAGGDLVELSFNRDVFGQAQGAGRWRETVLTLSAAQEGAPIRIDRVEMFDAAGQQRLLNADFTGGLQHWLPVAQGRFQPWHVDNLYIEAIIERGLFGLGVFGLLVLWALRNLWSGLCRGDAVAWAMLGSLVGMLSLGAVISVTEVPRVSLILLILGWSTEGFRGQMEGVSRCNRL